MIGLQIATVFWVSGENISLSSLIYMGLMMAGRQIHTAEPLVPQPNAFEIELAIEKPKKSQITT